MKEEEEFQALARDGGWPAIGAALTKLRSGKEWRQTAPNFSVYLRQLAPSTGHRPSYFWRCLSAYNYVRELSARYETRCEDLERLPLTAIEVIRWLAAKRPEKVKAALQNLIDGRETYRDVMRDNRRAEAGPKSAPEFEKLAMTTVINELTRHSYNPEVIVVQNFRLGLTELDAVIVDPDLHWIDGLEIKFHLSSRNARLVDRHLRSLATMFRRLWFVCPAGSQEHAEKIIDALASSSIRNVSLVLFDVASNEISIDDKAILLQSDDQYRRALKRSVVARGLGA